MKIQRRYTVFTLAILGLLIVLGALFLEKFRTSDQHSPLDFSDQPIGKQTLVQGGRLYDRHCRTCHGPSGRGNGPAAKTLSTPPAHLGSDTIARYSPEKLFRKITEGVPENGMPSWKGPLSVEQRKSIVHYIRQNFVNDPPES